MSSSDKKAQDSPFSFSVDTEKKAQEILQRYPTDRQASAVMPILTLAQKQNNGWLSKAAIAYVAEYLSLPEIRVWEVASFYSMYFLNPVGKYVVSVCGTTPCALKGSSKIMKACEKWLGISAGETTKDGMFTLLEVECLGACSNAPMIQVNDDYFEDLTPETTKNILEKLSENLAPEAGSQIGRVSSEPFEKKGARS